ncbi:dTDP-4-amino-4,6-dideoxygalactose transaminase [Vampirovibrio sp.]|uniref:dTDP-4-amino-4,6-dideoxygalactose transaminase n=1 Tax=Vampirovibrio sp. TaxID=2717857 RepID=UPI0035939D67
MVDTIPFNKPFLTGDELIYLQQALSQNHLSGNGPLTKQCQRLMETMISAHKVLLTHSATAALEMSGLVMGLKPGDEVIMPSFTFVSTASAFLMSGAVPVFVDIRPDTLNLDETKIEAAITERTRAIVVVHYAGVSCEMKRIQELANQHGLRIIEDAAHSFGSRYQGRALGTWGDLGIYSFHETKNIIAGEGGALIINHPHWLQSAEIIWEKGTNRAQFFRGEVDKYTWVRPGSSYLPSELTAAVLFAQLQKSDLILQSRLQVWNEYHRAFEPLEQQGLITRPTIPDQCEHNGHLYYILTHSPAVQKGLIAFLKAHHIHALFHYAPLHLSAAGKKYCKAPVPLPYTEALSEQLIRLPFWTGMPADVIHQVVHQVGRYFSDSP